MTKIILTDADGVLLDWEPQFEQWMTQLGFPVIDSNVKCKAKRHGVDMQFKDHQIHQFFTSQQMQSLPAYRDSVKYVTLLADRGYRFHVITAFSSVPHATEYRKHNLIALFGDIFVDYTFLATGSYKKQILQQFKGTNHFWIEDSVTNSVDGHAVGLNSILLTNQFNQHVDVPFPKLSSWSEIFYHITGEVTDDDDNNGRTSSTVSR